MALTFTGTDGVLRWGYHSAGTLRAWTVRRTEDGGRQLIATVVTLDNFKASQRPLRFVATHATGAWTWPIDTLEIQGVSLTARLGPKEKA